MCLKIFLPFLNEKRALKIFFVRGPFSLNSLSYFLLALFVVLIGFIDRG